jgi:agmatine/peptidylarginine deiminase
VVPRSWTDLRHRADEPRLAVVDWDYNAWGGKYPPFDLDEVVPTRVAKSSACRFIIRG